LQIVNQDTFFGNSFVIDFNQLKVTKMD